MVHTPYLYLPYKYPYLYPAVLCSSEAKTKNLMIYWPKIKLLSPGTTSVLHC